MGGPPKSPLIMKRTGFMILAKPSFMFPIKSLDICSIFLNPTHKKQFMVFMFGEEFMESEDKGSLKDYEVADNG